MAFLDIFKRGKTIDEIAAEIDGSAGHRYAGQKVTSATAREVSTVLACVTTIADSCAVPPLHVMRDLGGDQQEKARDIKAYRVFNRRPNEMQTSMEFRWTLTSHAALTGNGYALPTYVNGELCELLPLMPENVQLERTGRYDYLYVVQDEFGLVGKFKPDQMFHLRNNSWDRVKGLDAVKQARAAIGLSMAAEENQALMHANGSRPSGVLTTEQKLSPEAISRVRTAWKKLTTGKGAYGVPLLDRGLEFKKSGMSGADAESLDTRKFQVEEICRGFGVFPQMVGHSDKTATFASAEAFFAAHNRLTRGKWQQAWMQKGDEFVLDGAGPLFLQFDNRDLDAANLKDVGEFLSKALGAGGHQPFMSPNEARSFRGLPPKEGFDDIPERANAQKEDPNDDSGTKTVD